MLFVALIIPVIILNLCAWLLVIVCEVAWMAIGFISGRQEYEWLQWTDLIIDWMQEIIDRVTALNSMPNTKDKP